MIAVSEFCDTFPPCLDGVGRVALHYCRDMQERGYHMTYCGPEPKQIMGELPDRYVLCRGLSVPGQPYQLALPFTDKSFRRQLASEQPHLVHAHSPFTMGRMALRYAAKKQIPLIASFHTKYTFDIQHFTGTKFVTDRLMRHIIQFYNRAQEVWCPNNSTAEYLKEQGFQGKPVILEHGTEREEINPIMLAQQKQKYRWRENQLNLVFVGQIDRKKGLEQVLEMCKYLSEYQIDYCLRIVGQGQDERWARKHVCRIGIEQQVVFTGFIANRQELYCLYQYSDLLVLPSLYDTFSLVMREAAVMGTPTLTIAGSSMAEDIIDGYNGVTCEYRADVMAEKVRSCLQVLEVIGNNAQKTLPKSWEDVIDRVEQRYLQVIHTKEKAVEKELRK